MFSVILCIFPVKSVSFCLVHTIFVPWVLSFFRFLHWFLNIVIDLGRYSFFLLPLFNFRTNAYLKTVVDQIILVVKLLQDMDYVDYLLSVVNLLTLNNLLIKQICHSPYLHFKLTNWEIVLLLPIVVPHFIVAPEPCFSLSKKPRFSLNKMIFYSLTAKGLKTWNESLGQLKSNCIQNLITDYSMYKLMIIWQL